MERWPFSGVVGTPTRSLASVLFSARDGGAFAVWFGSRGLMLAMLCYAMKLSVLSLLARSFLFGGVPRLDLEVRS